MTAFVAGLAALEVACILTHPPSETFSSSSEDGKNASWGLGLVEFGFGFKVWFGSVEPFIWILSWISAGKPPFIDK